MQLNYTITKARQTTNKYLLFFPETETETETETESEDEGVVFCVARIILILDDT